MEIVSEQLIFEGQQVALLDSRSNHPAPFLMSAFAYNCLNAATVEYQSGFHIR
jgi:hypothetical protein